MVEGPPMRMKVKSLTARFPIANWDRSRCPYCGNDDAGQGRSRPTEGILAPSSPPSARAAAALSPSVAYGCAISPWSRKATAGC